MKLQTPLLRAGIAATLLGGFYLLAQPVAADLFSVDADAPLPATLLPTVSVTGDAASGESSMQLSSEQALPVTLLPTVHVRGRLPATARATVAMRVASAD